MCIEGHYKAGLSRNTVSSLCANTVSTAAFPTRISAIIAKGSNFVQRSLYIYVIANAKNVPCHLGHIQHT
jgi:hypothetical protein